jgi:hypothetical protein
MFNGYFSIQISYVGEVKHVDRKDRYKMLKLRYSVC